MTNYEFYDAGNPTVVMYKYTLPDDATRPHTGDRIKIPGFYGVYKIVSATPSSDPANQLVKFMVEPMSDLGPEFEYQNFDQNYMKLFKKGGGDLYLLRPKDLGDNFVY